MTKRTIVNRTKKGISFLGKNLGKRILQRQGINVTTKELRKLADNLDKQEEDFYNNLKLKKTKFKKVSKFKWLVNIINKSKASDTWEFEK